MNEPSKAYQVLAAISKPAEVQQYSFAKLKKLVVACRNRIIEATSKAGGHLASSLGSVELTVALYKVYNAEQDQFIWDVGHQGYSHKLLTGRNQQLDQIGKQGGVSKFLERCESPFDHFGAGHASTSISAALGMAIARDLSQQKHKVIAIIGDGAMTGGLAFEALNHGGHLKKDLLVILNDNNMSIDPNVGALSGKFNNLQSSAFNKIQASLAYNKLRHEVVRIGKKNQLSRFLVEGLRRLNNSFMEFLSPAVWFEKLGFRYFGPIDGHDLGMIIKFLNKTKTLNEPVLLHVKTVKGKGYSFAENDSLKYHGVTPFIASSGQFLAKKASGQAYTSVFGGALLALMQKDEAVTAMSAAMVGSTGLKNAAEKFPDRVFDVGIAEGHAVTCAAGLAASGKKPFVAIYSTFLQRALDHIIHDVAIQNLPVRFVLDRAGFVGADGATHHGAFDFNYLRMIPNLVIMAPKNGEELEQMVQTAYLHDESPIALRFPKGNCPIVKDNNKVQDNHKVEGKAKAENTKLKPIAIGSAELLQPGEHLLLLAIGSMVQTALDAAQLLKKKGVHCAVVNARFVKPLDERLITKHARQTLGIITLEENVKMGGFGSAVLELLQVKNILKPTLRLGIPDSFVSYGSVEEQREQAGLMDWQVAERAQKLYQQISNPAKRSLSATSSGQPKQTAKLNQPPE